MENNPLTMATTDELIEELFRRKTFAGVLIFSPETHRFQGQLHENLRLLTSCDGDSTVRLLANGAEAVEQKISEGGL